MALAAGGKTLESSGVITGSRRHARPPGCLRDQTTARASGALTRYGESNHPGMKFSVFALAALLATSLAAAALPLAASAASTPPVAPSSAEPYAPGPDAQRQPGVPQGKVIGPLVWTGGKIYPGMSRQYWLYVPAQYDPLVPACLMVFSDGWQYLREDGHVRAAIVFDNLIHRKEMPVTIGVFVNPGNAEGEAPPEGKNWNTRNRTIEYDTMSDAYVRFLIDEFLGHALKGYNLTHNAAGHAICGASSGGICAFTAAWWRPDYFQKVITHIGSFTDIRGGHVYPGKIRDAVRKPIRIAVQDGARDHNEPERSEEKNWVVQNKRLVAALTAKNYDHRYDFGEGGHSLRHGGAIFPDQLRWLWRDYQQTPPTMEQLAAQAAPDAPFGTPGTAWHLTFGGMSEPVTIEFRANNVMWWAEYQTQDNYEFKDGRLVTTAPADPVGRYRTWEIKGNTFARTIHNEGPDVELGGVARGTLKRAPLSEASRN
jgi:enterochelin esterase-like enzyme